MSELSAPMSTDEIEKREREKARPPGAGPAVKKLSKRETDYGRGTKQAHCAGCSHFVWSPYDKSVYDGSCSVVEGSIDPASWCIKFAKGTAQGETEKTEAAK